MKKSLIKHILLMLGGVAFLIAVWLTAYFCVGNDLLVPSFLATLKQTCLLFISPAFWLGFAGTLLRVLYAFLCSFVLAVGLAVIAYLYPAFRDVFAPVVAVLRSLPVLAVLLIIFVWTGENTAPVIVAFLSLFPILYTATLSALYGVDSDLLEMSRVYKVPVKTQVKKLYLPAVTPKLIKEGGASLAFGVKLVVSAEVLARTKHSLGAMMQNAKLYEQLPKLFALVIVVCLVGFVLESVFISLSKRVQRRGKCN